MEQNEIKTWGKRESKIIVRLFLIVVAGLLLMNVWEAVSPQIFKSTSQSETVEKSERFGPKHFQNEKIDRLEPLIRQNEKSDYSKDDINSAVNCVKAKFKENEGNVNLLSLSFDEKKSNAFRDGCYATEKFGKENVLVLFCNYTVFDSLGGKAKSKYENWAMILTRSSKTAPWIVFDEGY